MTPEEKQGAGNGEEEQHGDETQEHEVEGVFDGHEHLDAESEEPEAHEDGSDAEPPKEVGAPAGADAEEAVSDEDVGSEDAPLDDDDSELDQVIAAETQEWDAVEAAEEEDEDEEADEAEEEPDDEEEEPEPAEQDEPTLVAAAGKRIGEATNMATARVKEWRPGFPLWLRFLTASVLIIFSVAGAVSASLILYLGDIASALKDPTGALAGADKFVTQVDGGGPQTILILGSDKRPEDKGSNFKGLSDTTMLLRLDPDREAIALFSLPRDLRVDIPGYGSDKLNAAYAYGGPVLTLQTVESLLSSPGRPFEVNHLVNVDFEGFARAVNEIDCVYVDVDRRYFHSNDSTGALSDYEEIDLQPGYQALCGFDALDYARYRHTDNDVVRAARQQEFLREARSKIPPDKLISDRKDLISIFTEHTTSDIDDPQTMLQVLKLFLEARDAPIKEVHFEGTLGPSFVTATTEQLQTAVTQFLGFQASGAGGQSAEPDEPVTPEAAPDETPVTSDGEGKKKASEPPEPSDGPVDNDYSVTQTSFGRELSRVLRRRVAKLPILYPTLLETGSDFDQKPRVYKINGTGDGAPPQGERSAYKWVFSRPALGEYYGFMATAWEDPPILEDPDVTREVGDREYKIYLDGGRVRMVAWEDDNGSYWLTNTLIESLSAREMLKIAQGFKELPRAGG